MDSGTSGSALTSFPLIVTIPECKGYKTIIKCLILSIVLNSIIRLMPKAAKAMVR